MAAAASSDFPAFPTTAYASLESNAAAFSGGGSTYGCPESDFESLGLACDQTSNIPSCLAAVITNTDISATVVDYNAACCTSISLWAMGIESCVQKNAPSCLDTSAVLASATQEAEFYATESNPCAPYWNGGKGTGPVQTPGPSTQAGSTQAGSTQAGSTQAGSTQAGNTQAGSTQAGSATTGSATGTSSGGSTAETKASAATKTGAGLKVYLGLGLAGALAVLTM